MTQHILDINPEKTTILKDTRFMAAPFTIASIWKQSRHPLIEEWINTVEYYSGIKKKVFESVVARWMNVEPVTQTEVSKIKTKIIH